MSCHVTSNVGISTDVNDINIVKKYENHMKIERTMHRNMKMHIKLKTL